MRSASLLAQARGAWAGPFASDRLFQVSFQHSHLLESQVRLLSTGPVGSQVGVVVQKSESARQEDILLTRYAPQSASPRKPQESDRSDRTSMSTQSWLR